MSTTALASTSGFDAHTAVAADRDRYTADVSQELSGFAGAHGGYLSAIGLRAMMARVADPARAPRMLTVHLAAAVRPGPLVLEPRIDRTGSTMTAASLRMAQDGATVATAIAAFGRGRPGLEHDGLTMPDVPPPEACRPLLEKPVATATAGLLVEHRPATGPLPLSGGDRARIVVWMRLVEERPLDALVATMLADAGPPALYGRLDRFVAIPSTDIALHFADVAAAVASPWLLADLRTSHAAAGYAIEDGELWTPGGRLVLLARQLRRVLDKT